MIWPKHSDGRKLFLKGLSSHINSHQINVILHFLLFSGPNYPNLVDKCIQLQQILTKIYLFPLPYNALKIIGTIEGLSCNLL